MAANTSNNERGKTCNLIKLTLNRENGMFFVVD